MFCEMWAWLKREGSFETQGKQAPPLQKHTEGVTIIRWSRSRCRIAGVTFTAGSYLLAASAAGGGFLLLVAGFLD